MARKPSNPKKRPRKGLAETTSSPGPRWGGDSTAPEAADEELLTMDQAIDLLKTTRPTFYRWLRAGKVRGMKVGRQWRFYRGDIERFLAGQGPRVDLPADIAPLIRVLRKRACSLAC